MTAVIVETKSAQQRLLTMSLMTAETNTLAFLLTNIF